MYAHLSEGLFFMLEGKGWPGFLEQLNNVGAGAAEDLGISDFDYA